jgi:MoaA/NifB/PqqE/SkfB family radical SAM enzyme
MSTIMPSSPAPVGVRTVAVLEVEFGEFCGLRCEHCYASSGPKRGFGTLTTSDWLNVIDQAATLGIGRLQAIGGEPTARPGFPQLIGHALDVGMGVEVYTNLTAVPATWWDGLLRRPGLRLATSYYSDLAEQHDRVTGVPGSHAATRANIAEAVRRAVPIRAGIVAVHPGQRVTEARADLERLGVATITVDRMRAVGRGRRPGRPASVGELCGHCARGKAAISPDGDVWGCGIARFLPPAGNVKSAALADILAGPAMDRLRELIPAPRAASCAPEEGKCSPDDPCNPGDTVPDICGPDLRK